MNFNKDTGRNELSVGRVATIALLILAIARYWAVSLELPNSLETMIMVLLGYNAADKVIKAPWKTSPIAEVLTELKEVVSPPAKIPSSILQPVEVSPESPEK
jgi:hypothetical protein